MSTEPKSIYEIYTIWSRRNDGPDWAPEMVEAWDNIDVEDRYEEWEMALLMHQSKPNTDVRVVIISVPNTTIDNAFLLRHDEPKE